MAQVEPPEDARRFEFGKNWARFARHVTGERIAAAERSLAELLECPSLAGKRFLDVGSGSGLFSLAARRLGAAVCSFDLDAESVACTQALKDRYQPGDAQWVVERGSALDAGYLRSLGRFDVVYAWGVLHHTGAMWTALENVIGCVQPGGLLAVSLYHDQGWLSRYWRAVKRLYNRGPAWRLALTAMHWPYLVGLRFLVRAATGRLAHERGMSLWYDMRDWLGGYPFEVARPEEVIAFAAARGGTLKKLVRVRGNRHGCNEYVVVLHPSEPAPV